MEQEVLARARASAGRRGLGVGTLGCLGALLIYLAFAHPPAEIAGKAILVVIGVLALWAANRMRLATRYVIELTHTEIRCSNGERIAAIADIQAVDRGTFAFKPSNGFIIKLKSTGKARWQPGLWWQVGKRIGIGGVMPGSQTKSMAEIISALKMENSENR